MINDAISHTHTHTIITGYEHYVCVCVTQNQQHKLFFVKIVENNINFFYLFISYFEFRNENESFEESGEKI